MQTGVLVKERRLLSTFIEQYLFFVSSPLDLLLIVLFPVTNQIPLLDRRSSQNNDALNESSPYNCITSHWNNKLCFTLLDSQIRRHSYTKNIIRFKFFQVCLKFDIPSFAFSTNWLDIPLLRRQPYKGLFAWFEVTRNILNGSFWATIVNNDVSKAKDGHGEGWQFCRSGRPEINLRLKHL